MSRTKTAKAPKPNEPTTAERASVRVILDKLTIRNGVKYEASQAHTRLIIARLRDGLTEMDLRSVIGYCSLELEWATKPNMQPYLRPETLFGPETIQRYLDPARSWFDKLPSDEKGQRRPGATIHRLPQPMAALPERISQNEAQALVEQTAAAMRMLFPNAVEES